MTPALVLAAALGADPVPAVRTSLSPAGDVWVGQRVTLVVELLTPGQFAGAPAFDLPQVPGAVILKPDDRPTLGSETVGGTTVIIQRHEFAVYPQRAGVVEVPAFPVRFGTSEGFGTPVTARRVTTAPVRFAAKLPPGAAGLATVVTTRRLTVTETWAPEPKAAAVGAAFTRTITVEARDVPGMALPAFTFEPPAGLRAYPKPPAVEDRVNRGDLTGRRMETVTYVCEKPGAYALPALALAWWNPDERVLNRERLPGRSFEVAAAPPAPAATPPAAPPRRSWVPLAAVLVGLVGAAGLAWRFGPAVGARWRRHRAAVAASEPTAFTAFRRACRSGDPRAVNPALLAWLDRFQADGSVPTADQFAARAGDPQLAAQLAALRAAAYGPAPAGWSPADFAHRVGAARARIARRHRPRVDALPPLNPGG
ncbi:MAG TPA: hypothetical protein VH092_34515 [Urbifossiella sp.]|jgi:hypothetical protein|nr:hypothetical protein [Urbifossiella sp.]